MINTPPDPSSISSQVQLELGKVLLRHDPTAIRIYDFINHVKCFSYNTNENRWNIDPYIEGNLFLYEQKPIDNQPYPSYAFAIINQHQRFIQRIHLEMVPQAAKLRLFYEIVINGIHQIFCLRFINEHECQRLNTFIIQSMEKFKSQQEERQNIIKTNSRTTSTDNNHQQQLTKDASISIQADSNKAEHSTSMLNHLPNFQNSKYDSSLIQEKTPINLVTPATFQSPSHCSSDNEHSQRCVPSMNREYFRHILLELMHENDQFFHMINHEYLNRPTS